MVGDQCIAEDGQPAGSAMPGFKGVPPQRDIWALVTYVQDGLPQR